MNCIPFHNFSDDLVERMELFIINSIIHTSQCFESVGALAVIIPDQKAEQEEHSLSWII